VVYNLFACLKAWLVTNGALVSGLGRQHSARVLLGAQPEQEHQI
jgi:hypothetical protein